MFVTRKSVSDSSHSSILSPILNNLEQNSTALDELRSLSREQDPEIFQQSLMVFGLRQEGAGNSALAVRAYQAVQQIAGVSSELVTRAQSRVQALLGQGGSLGDQWEVSSGAFLKRAAVTSAAMVPAWLAYSATRLTLWNGLAGRAAANLLTRGGSKAVASLLAIGLVEGPVLTATQRVLGSMAGSFTEDLAANYRLMLGLRAASGAGVLASRTMGLSRGVLQAAVQQASTLGGIYLTHDNLSLAQALQTLGYFSINGAVVGGILGRPFAAREQALEQAPVRPTASGTAAWRENLTAGPSLAHAAVGSIESATKSFRTESSRPPWEFDRVSIRGTGGAAVGFPTADQIIPEYKRLRQRWLDDGGELRINGQEVIRKGQGNPDSVDLQALRTDMHDRKRQPIIVGGDQLVSPLLGKVRMALANLNSVEVLFEKPYLSPLAHIGLEIITGRLLDPLPPMGGIQIPQYPMLPYQLVWLRNQLTSRDGVKLTRPDIVSQFFSGNEGLAAEAMPYVLDTNSIERRGWSDGSSVARDLSSGTAASRLAPLAPPRKTILTLTPNDVAGIIPEGGGVPGHYMDVTNAVKKGGFEHVFDPSNESGIPSIGWWTPVPRQGGYQANILGMIPEFGPKQIYDLLSNRNEWPPVYPGVYAMKLLNPDKEIYMLAMKTPAGKIRMFSQQTVASDQFQVRWRSPELKDTQSLNMELESDEKKIERIQGSITLAPTPNGNGSLMVYELFMTSQQTGTGTSIDPFADLRAGEVATMARVPPLLTTVYAKLSAVRDGRAWGIYDPDTLHQYRNNRDGLKGSPPEKIKYQPKVWVIDK